jgi:GGDEF domain-containing protein
MNLARRRQSPFTLAPTHHHLTCSFGIVTFKEIPVQVDGVLATADALMYDAKRRGGNLIACRIVDAR